MARVQIAVATLSGNRLRQTVHTHRAHVHQAAKLVAALLRVAGVTAGLAESNGSLTPDLWLTSPAGWLPRTEISPGTLRSVIEYYLYFYLLVVSRVHWDVISCDLARRCVWSGEAACRYHGKQRAMNGSGRVQWRPARSVWRWSSIDGIREWLILMPLNTDAASWWRNSLSPLNRNRSTAPGYRISIILFQVPIFTAAHWYRLIIDALSAITWHKLCYRRRTVRRAISVNILSTVETIGTTNPQQIAVIELEGYSWPTCSKQPRVVDCRIFNVYVILRFRSA